jgi:hypothetical protein
MWHEFRSISGIQPAIAQTLWEIAQNEATAAGICPELRTIDTRCDKIFVLVYKS